MTCAPCMYAADHDWWGPNHVGTHCPGCHRTWTGLAERHCAVCHLHFSSEVPWDAHFDGERHRSLGELQGLLTEARIPRFKVVDRVSGPVVVNYSDTEHFFAAVAS